MNAKTLKHLSKIDPVMARLIRKAERCSLAPQPRVTPFAALAESIVYQQLAGKAAATIWGRVLSLYPRKRLPAPAQVLKTPYRKLRAAGLSHNKVLALKDLALKATKGIVPTRKIAESLSDDELISRLTSVRGIGPWTVQMFLIFTLARPDVFPSDDYGVRNGYKLAYRKRDMPKPKVLAKFGERWKPYRSTASWYLWRAVDLSRD